MSAAPRRSLAVALVWAALFLASRLFALATEADAIYTPDELYNGALALELAAGRGLTPLALNAHAPYSGGPILLAWTAAPLFQLLGQSLFALRLPSLLLASAMAGIWILTLGRLYGSRAQHLLGLLFVLSPPQFTRLTLLAWGNHTESTFFTALTVLAIVAAVRKESESGLRLSKPRARALLLVCIAGVSASTALLFSLAAAIHLAGVAIVLGAVTLARFGGARSLGWLASFGAGAGIGAVPALLLALGRRSHGVTALAESGRPLLSDAPRRLFTLFAYDLRHYLAPDGAWPRLVAIALFLAALLALTSLTLRALARLRTGVVQSEWLFLLPVYGFGLAYAFTSFPLGPRAADFMGYRYLAVITPCLLAVLARGLSLIPTSARTLLALALVLPNFATALAGLSRASGYVHRASPASYQSYGIHAFETLGYELDPALAILRRIEPEAARLAALDGLALRHIVHHFTRMDETGGGAVAHYVRDHLPAAPERALFLDRLAHTLLRTPSFTVSSEACLNALAELSDDDLASVAMALVATSTSPCPALDTLPAPLRAGAIAGLGARFARTGEVLPTLGSTLDRESLAYGFGYARATRRLALGLISAVPSLELTTAAERHADSRGVAEALRLFEIEDPERRAVVAERAGLTTVE